MLITLSEIKDLKIGDKVFYIANQLYSVEWVKNVNDMVVLKFNDCHPIIEKPNKKIFKIVTFKSQINGDDSNGKS